MKLYATTKNSKGKKEGVGDDVSLTIRLAKGNKEEYLIYYCSEGLHLYEIVNKEGAGRKLLDTINKRQKAKRLS